MRFTCLLSFYPQPTIQQLKCSLWSSKRQSTLCSQEMSSKWPDLTSFLPQHLCILRSCGDRRQVLGPMIWCTESTEIASLPLMSRHRKQGAINLHPRTLNCICMIWSRPNGLQGFKCALRYTSLGLFVNLSSLCSLCQRRGDDGTLLSCLSKRLTNNEIVFLCPVVTRWLDILLALQSLSAGALHDSLGCTEGCRLAHSSSEVLLPLPACISKLSQSSPPTITH